YRRYNSGVKNFMPVLEGLPFFGFIKRMSIWRSWIRLTVWQGVLARGGMGRTPLVRAVRRLFDLARQTPIGADSATANHDVKSGFPSGNCCRLVNLGTFAN